MAEWLFHKLGPKEPQRESTVGAFFTSDAIGSPIQAIIREGIQNTLDASRDPEIPVKVRIYLSGISGALDKNKTSQYFSSGRIHWESKDSGLGESLPALDGPCPFLVFEDFGTCGLEGDFTLAHFKESGKKNHFYHFFRAEGQSDKEKDNRGSWGVGKHVFLMNSAIRTFLGYTVRETDKESLLMGRTVLKMHSIGKDYYQDGFFAVDEGGSKPFLPIRGNAPLLENFRDDFNLKRGTEPGLSIVVPWPIGYQNECTECGWIALQIIQEYYLPIIMGDLVAEIECHGQLPLMLDSADSIRKVMEMPCNSAINKKNMDDARADRSEIEAWLSLAEYAVCNKETPDFIGRAPNPGPRKNTWRWDKELFDDSELIAIKGKLDKDGIVGIQIPLNLWKKNECRALETFFSLYLLRNETKTSSKTEYIREGIVISRGGQSESLEYYSMLIVENGPLAELLRLSENPSHTEWQHNRVRDLYASGIVQGMQFIKQSVRGLTSLLAGSSKEEDKTLLSNFFSIDFPPDLGEEDPEPKRKRSNMPGDQTVPEPEIPPSQPRAYSIQRTENGFRIIGQRDEWIEGKLIRVVVAYDVNRGDPFRKYSSADFSLSGSTITLDCSDVELISTSRNVMVLRPLIGRFSVIASGFDVNRQVIISAKILAEDENNDD